MTWSPARTAALVGSVLASVVFSLPLIAAFAPGVGWIPRVVLLGTFTASAVRPAAGLCLLVVVLPLAAVPVAGGLTGTAFTDMCLLAFVAGASLRIVVPDRDRPDRLAGPVVVLIAAVVTSAMVEMHLLQLVSPRRPLASEIWHHVTREYWSAERVFAGVHETIRWVAGLTAALYVERILRRDGVAAPWAFGSWMAAGAIGGLLTLPMLMDFVARIGPPISTGLFRLAAVVRMSALQPDLNAAASYFALFLLPALVVGWRRGPRWILAGVLPLVMLAFLLARSRAAIAMVLLLISGQVALVLHRTRGARWSVGVGLAGLIALATLVMATGRSHVDLGAATEVRLQLAQIGGETAMRFPVFGVGLGDYIRMTRRNIEPDMLALQSFAPLGENAHNNYLQVLVELGLPACLVFIFLGWSTALFGWGVGRGVGVPTPEARGMALGVLVFLSTALTGHPLVVPQVSAAFFLAIGLTAGLVPAPPRPGPNRQLVIRAGVLFYALSLLWRLG